MKMWIARDEDGLLQLLFEKEPRKEIYERIVVWRNDSMWDAVALDRDSYPEVTFENSPKEVKLKLIEK